ncbi:MAG: sigma-54-dependent Fis family transcriptional regulator [Deltaproteobacteria bacterium]|nr:sigma-54-dependent Fis family transcriptional regulator [Deltaproteobacteria bacterium]
MATVLVIDDNDTLRDGVVAVVERMKLRAVSANSGRLGLELFGQNEVDLVITDLKMDGLDGIGVLRAVKERAPDVAVIVMTAFGTIETAVEAMKLGAFDFITKPFSTSAVRMKIEHALEWRSLKEQNERLAQMEEMHRRDRDRAVVGLPGDARADTTEPGVAFQGMVAASAVMSDLFGKIKKVAASDTNVLVTGESGTGKELVADALHRLSRRASGPFIKVNCTAITESLLESELFGHEKGAFTGAIKKKLGRFELAHGGTIFLDEIGEISAAMQMKLLRVLQERTFERVGGEKQVSVDVRVVSATNRNLKTEVEAGRFREDLFYRLHIVPLHLPPLRERTDDIVPLARHFVSKLRARTNSDVAGLSSEAEAKLRAYHFPGNVRELENIVEQALVFATPPTIEASDLPAQVSGAEASESTFSLDVSNMGLDEFLENAERQMILSAYEAAGGVKTETARRLKIKTSALYYKLEKYGIGSVAGRDLSRPDAPADDALPVSTGSPDDR